MSNKRIVNDIIKTTARKSYKHGFNAGVEAMRVECKDHTNECIERAFDQGMNAANEKRDREDETSFHNGKLLVIGLVCLILVAYIVGLHVGRS